MTSLATPAFTPGAGARRDASWSVPRRHVSDLAQRLVSQSRMVTVAFDTAYSPVKSRTVSVVAARVNELLLLPDDWDDGGASPISELAALTALVWLDIVSTDHTPVPHVVPLASGGVQLEWISAGRAFEVEVSSTGGIAILGVDAAGDVLVVGEFPSAAGASAAGEGRRFLTSMFDSADPVWFQ